MHAGDGQDRRSPPPPESPWWLPAVARPRTSSPVSPSNALSLIRDPQAATGDPAELYRLDKLTAPRSPRLGHAGKVRLPVDSCSTWQHGLLRPCQLSSYSIGAEWEGLDCRRLMCQSCQHCVATPAVSSKMLGVACRPRTCTAHSQSRSRLLLVSNSQQHLDHLSAS